MEPLDGFVIVMYYPVMHDEFYTLHVAVRLNAVSISYTVESLYKGTPEMRTFPSMKTLCMVLATCTYRSVQKYP